MLRNVTWIAALTLAIASGCGGDKPSASNLPTFVLSWSEYPSWSVFGVAHVKNLINGEQGKLGPIEEKWGVDIVLKQADYDGCLAQYNTGQADAVCITNMDILSPSLGRKSVAICPTSTSNGADACIVVGIENAQELRNHKVYGLDLSVSQYCFVRNLQELGENPADHQFSAKGPAEAAVAMQTDPENNRAIMVWNPFVLQTLKKVPGSKVLFDSSTIPGEIVDMVVVAEGSLNRPGGKEFAAAVIDTFYQVSDLIEASGTRDETLLLLAEKFAPELTVEDMQTVVQQTAFYKTPDAGIELFTGKQLPETMNKVVAFCVDHGMVDNPPKIAFGAEGDVNLRFDTTYMQLVKDKK